MREIKFRAWDKENKAFMPNEGYVICDGDVMGLRYGNEMEDVLTDQVELMQYTGLKDMNGVEIYECDIVQVNYSGNDDFSGLALVVFRNGCFELEGKIMKIINSEGIMYDDFYAISNDLSHYSACVKVIGNKFKNPKLMETVL